MSRPHRIQNWFGGAPCQVRWNNAKHDCELTTQHLHVYFDPPGTHPSQVMTPEEYEILWPTPQAGSAGSEIVRYDDGRIMFPSEPSPVEGMRILKIAWQGTNQWDMTYQLVTFDPLQYTFVPGPDGPYEICPDGRVVRLLPHADGRRNTETYGYWKLGGPR